MLVHDREAELKFISEGYGVDRRQIAWNDFVVVGPDQDPARIKGGHDAVAAFKAIAGAKAPFVSRGDNSGTNALELRLWKSTAIEPKEGAGSWYRDIGGGMGTEKRGWRKRGGWPTGWSRKKASKLSAAMKSMASSFFIPRLPPQNERSTGGASRRVRS